MVETDRKEIRLVDAFLRTGATGRRSIDEIVAMCDRRIRAATQVSVPESIALAEAFLRRLKSHDSRYLLTAWRAAGWAYLVGARYKSAKKAYLAARARCASEPLSRARIDRTLIDVSMYLDDFPGAQKRARMAMATFRRLRADDDLAMTRVNLANAFHRQDRHREAYQLYHGAGEHFKSRNNHLSAALCWYNEANTLVQLCEFGRAEALYSQARRIFTDNDRQLHAIGCLYGLAWLHMLEGGFHLALQELTECEQFYASGGHRRETLLCQLDRAESFLGLNLFLDARRTAEPAARAAKSMGLSYEHAKAEFFMARASAGMGQIRASRRLLASAEARFRHLRNTGFAAAARWDLELLERRARNWGRRHRGSIVPLMRQLPLWEAIRDLELAAIQPSDDRAFKRLATNPAVKMIPHLAARRQTLLGDRAAKLHRSEQAVSRWSQAADILDAVRAKLPPIELRSSYFSQLGDPFHRLIAFQAESDPKQAATWAERFKTVGLWSVVDSDLADHPDRAKVFDRLSELAGHVAAYSELTTAGSGKRSVIAARSGRMTQLREQVRDAMISLYASDRVIRQDVASLGALIDDVSKDQPIVHFHMDPQDIISFVHINGECRSHRHVGGVRILDEVIAKWRFLMECAPANGRTVRASDLDGERRLLESVGDWLMAPLEIPESTRKLVIVPAGRLFCIPWAAVSIGGTRCMNGIT